VIKKIIFGRLVAVGIDLTARSFGFSLPSAQSGKTSTQASAKILVMLFSLFLQSILTFQFLIAAKGQGLN
jgi:hypothetical protein